MTALEYDNKYKTLRKLGKALVPVKDLFAFFSDALQKLGFESVADSTRQRGPVSVKIVSDIDGDEGDVKAVVSAYNKEVARFTIFPTTECLIRLGQEIEKAENLAANQVHILIPKKDFRRYRMELWHAVNLWGDNDSTTAALRNLATLFDNITTEK